MQQYDFTTRYSLMATVLDYSRLHRYVFKVWGEFAAHVMNMEICLFNVLSKWIYWPWSVNGKSVKSQSLNICFHLSLEENPVMMNLWSSYVNFYDRCTDSSDMRKSAERGNKLPWLWGRENCYFYQLLWRTPGETACSLPPWRAQLILKHSRDQRGWILPEIQ